MNLERRNLELKAADRQPERTVRLCESLAGVSDVGVLEQRDTYFETGAGRLKLREEKGAQAELIYYERPATEGVRTSSYWRVPVSAPRELAEVLTRAHGVVGVVEKERRLFLWRNVRIHLDDVRGLGAFVELEAVHGNFDDTAADEDAVAHLVEALELDTASLEPRGYLDLLPGRVS